MKMNAIEMLSSALILRVRRRDLRVKLLYEQGPCETGKHERKEKAQHRGINEN